MSSSQNPTTPGAAEGDAPAASAPAINPSSPSSPASPPSPASAASSLSAASAASPASPASSARVPSPTMSSSPVVASARDARWSALQPVDEDEAPPHVLERLFHPRSVALIGGNDDPTSIGGAILDNLQRAGYDGDLVVVNPDPAAPATIGRFPVLKSIAALTAPPDLAIIATAAPTWAPTLEQLASVHARFAMVVSPGSPIRECCASDAQVAEEIEASRALARLASRLGIRLVGPGSIGLVHPASKLDASFARAIPSPGSLALITRSGATLAALLDMATGSGIGVSLAVSCGQGSDIDTGEVLDFLTFDPTTRSIALVVESIHDSRAFVSTLRAAARAKPVVVLHAGGQLLGELERAAFDAAIARSGAVRVDTFGDLFSAVESLSTRRMPRGERLGVVVNGPGLAMLAANACATHRVEMVTCADGTRLRDVGEAATPAQFAEATEALVAERANDAVLALFSPTRMAGAGEVADALLAVAQSRSASALLCCLVGAEDAVIGRDRLNDAGLVVFDTPDAAVRGFAVLAEYQRNQRQLLEAPRQAEQSRPLEVARIDALLAAAAARSESQLDEWSTHSLLDACGIPIASALYTGDIDEASAWSRQGGYPVRLAVIPPKDARGEVPLDAKGRPIKGEERIDIRSERELRGAAAALRGRWLERWPEATFTGFRLRRMLDGRDTLALRVTIEVDPTFGPVLRFGAGGRAALLAPGLATALPPLTRMLAEDMIAATPVINFLRNDPGFATVHELLIDTLLALSELAVRYPAIRMLRIDPIYADVRGLTAGAAKILIDPTNPQHDLRHGHLAIHPYPVELEKRTTLKNGRDVFIRPIRPDDAPLISALFDTLSDQTRHWRFLHPIKMLTPQMIARFTQVDYERDLALVGLTLKDPADPAAGELMLGVTRYVREADESRAEFAIVVTDDWQGTGLASALMSELIAHARRIGLKRLVGLVHRQNLRMLQFMRRQGFRIDRSTSEPSLQVTTLDLP